MKETHGATGTPLLSVKVDHEDSRVVVHLVGELDISTAPLLQASLIDVLENRPEEVALDLADLHYVDSTGLSLFVASTKRARTMGSKLTLQNPQSSTRRLLEITDLNSFLEVGGPSPEGSR